jgi:hypothetical protein
MFMRFRPQGLQNGGKKSSGYFAFRFNSIHPQIVNTSYSDIISEISTGLDSDVDKWISFLSKTWSNKLYCTIFKEEFPTSQKRHWVLITKMSLLIICYKLSFVVIMIRIVMKLLWWTSKVYDVKTGDMRLPKWPKCLFDYDKYAAKSRKIYLHVKVF